ncbi:MAG: hypothetical protein ACKVWR_16925 [Acidimicrobiales bacterium]
MKKIGPALVTAFLVIGLIRNPVGAGQIVQQIGELLNIVAVQLKDVLEQLF